MMKWREAKAGRNQPKKSLHIMRKLEKSLCNLLYNAMDQLEGLQTVYNGMPN